MGAFIPLLLALAATEFLRHSAGPTTWQLQLGAVGVAAALWLLACEGAARIVAWRGERRWLKRWELVAQGLGLGLFAWLCRGYGWSAWAPGYTAAIAPWLLFQCLMWWTLAPALRQVCGAPWSRGGLVLHHLRFELAPILIALPVIDACSFIGNRLSIMNWFTGPDGLLLQVIGGWLLVVPIAALVPLLIVWLWGARPMPAGPLADILAADCARAGLGDVRLRLWDSPGGSVHNAVALGMAPGPRWVLLSSDLVRDLPPDQVRAVVGHELGHHRHRHLPSYLWFGFVANMAVLAMMAVLVGTSDSHGRALPFGISSMGQTGILFQIPGVHGLPSDAVIGAALVVLVLLVWRVLFGVLSRACERQADIAGAELVGSEHMAEALRTVARLSGTPEDAPSWRHRPISARIAFLAEMAGTPQLAQDHHRLVRDMRLLLIASLALLVALAAGMMFNPVRQAATHDDPAGQITAMTGKDPELAEAVATADKGDTSRLIEWLKHAEPVDRVRFAVLHNRLIELSGGRDAGGKQLPGDDRSIYPLRWRYSAMSAVSMEDASLNLGIDNTLAYGLVAGTAHPTPRDIELARSLLARLEPAVERDPDPGILDTIGCVHFMAGEWEAARKAFAKTGELLAKADVPAELVAKDRQLNARRLQATEHNLAVAAGTRQAPQMPLPLTFQEPTKP